MWSFIKGLFSSPKVVETGLDLVKRGADAVDVMFFTEEEKAEARKKWWTEVFLPLERILAPQGAIRSVTRRILASYFCRTYLFLILLDAAVYPINPMWSKHLLELVKILSYPVSGIILFYFGSYGIGTYLLGKDKGEGKKKLADPDIM
ncbi:hypothetical protein DRN93_01440 [archaeon]|nr:MAG: hypothetical protein DRN93_01440 [archaeon]